MSPEQAKNRATDHRSDVFAFGCVLYEMLTSIQAFQGDDVSDVMASVMKLEPVFQSVARESESEVLRVAAPVCCEESQRRLACDRRCARRAANIPGLAGAIEPFFSPDGQWIGFFSLEDRALKKVALSGGASHDMQTGGPADRRQLV